MNLLNLFPSRCSKQTSFIVWESKSILKLRPSDRYPKGKHHIKPSIFFSSAFQTCFYPFAWNVFLSCSVCSPDSAYDSCFSLTSYWFSVMCIVHNTAQTQTANTRLKEILNYSCFILVREHYIMNIIHGFFYKMCLQAVVTRRVKSNQVIIYI